MRNNSLNPASKINSGGTCEPLQLKMVAQGCWPLAKHYRQAFDYCARTVPGRPRYVVLCNFDEFWVYAFETKMDSPLLPRRHDRFPQIPAL